MGLDASLMTSGLSSANILLFVDAINATFGARLSATLVFECDTPSNAPNSTNEPAGTASGSSAAKREEG